MRMAVRLQRLAVLTNNKSMHKFCNIVNFDKFDVCLIVLGFCHLQTFAMTFG